MPDEFYSQCGEVKWIVDNLPLPPRGVFVDVGAHDGITDSNTAYFERVLGWSGLVIDGDPRNWEPLIHNRGCRAFLGAIGPDRDAAFGISESSHHSGFGRGYPARVPVLPLHAVLDVYGIGSVDLLSIDTEGSELAVWDTLKLFGADGDGLRTISPERAPPGIVIIEWYTTGIGGPDLDNRAAVIERMGRDGYDVRAQLCGNLIFTWRAAQ